MLPRSKVDLADAQPQPVVIAARDRDRQSVAREREPLHRAGMGVQHLGEIREGVARAVWVVACPGDGDRAPEQLDPFVDAAVPAYAIPRVFRELRLGVAVMRGRRGRESLLAVAHGVAVAPTQDERPR